MSILQLVCMRGGFYILSFSSVLQNKWYQNKKVKKLGLVTSPQIVQQLLIGVDHAINSSPQTGCDFCITLDLRASAKKRNFLQLCVSSTSAFITSSFQALFIA